MKNLTLTTLSACTLFLGACGSSNSTSPTTTSPGTMTPSSSSVTSNLDSTSESARYRITFTAQWTSDNFGSIPGGAHFTTLIGSAVSSASSLWARNETASLGLENVAEDGTTSNFGNEIATEVNNNTALGAVTISGTGATGSSTAEYTLNRTYPLFTFASMVAPTPDWFVGLSEYNLQNASGEWVSDVTVPLRVYDAGTEDGNDFSRANAATVPRGIIHRLDETIANGTVFSQGLVNGNAIANIRFERIQ